MENIIEIEGKEVRRIFYKGEPVVTFAMIDELHQRKKGTSIRNFNNNKSKLIEGEDYFEVPYEEWKDMFDDEDEILKGENLPFQDCRKRNAENEILIRKIFPDQNYRKRNSVKNENGGYRGNIIFLTKTGYLMLTKSLTDDLAWKIQRKLVNHYFNVPENNGRPSNDIFKTFCQLGSRLLNGEVIVRLTRHDDGDTFDAKVIQEDHRERTVRKIKTQKQLPSSPRKHDPNRLAYQRMETTLLFLNALLKGYGLDHGVHVTLDKDGRPHFIVPTGKLVSVFRKIGERKDFPAFPYSPFEFGSLFGRSKSDLSKQGWSREEVKISNGTRHYQYTYSNPTFDDM